jgi:hypothetical protein
VQPLGGRRDHGDAREQLPPSAPSKSVDWCWSSEALELDIALAKSENGGKRTKKSEKLEAENACCR